MSSAVARGASEASGVEGAVDSSAAPSVALVALGCAKNTVDAEVMLGDLERHGIRVLDEPDAADVVIVNTCGFIEEAKQASIDAILDAAQLKDAAGVRGLIVTGCMAQRYAAELAAELPEVDAIVGFENYSEVPDTVIRLLSTTLSQGAPSKAARVAVGGATVPFRPEWGRRRLTPRHTAFLRVAEGCDHKCTFCAIPGFRGKFRSKPWNDVLDEARRLAASGVVELNLIAEDTNQYGTDFGASDSRRLHDLLYALVDIEGIRWIRLLYCYPSYFSEELIRAIAEIPQVVKYVDMPLQHIADNTLRAMQRPLREHTMRILRRLQEAVPGIAIRSTFISGFPGESAADHRELVDFVRSFGFMRAGVFSYSTEEGTPAALMTDAMLDETTKQARFDELTSVQQELEERFAREQIGSVIEVLVDRVEDGHSIARSAFDAPEIDSIVHVVQQLAPGSIHKVRVVGSHAFDLIADANLDAELDDAYVARDEFEADVADKSGGEFLGTSLTSEDDGDDLKEGDEEEKLVELKLV